MNISSSAFLFLFLPVCAVLYYLIPAKKSLTGRNVLLLLASLFFYAWDSVARFPILLALIFVTWLLGLWVEGKKGTKLGKFIVFLNVLINVSALFLYKYLDLALATVGSLTGRTFASPGWIIPLGLSFLCFQSTSYVVDIYRKKATAQKNPLYAALYLSIFFKIASGPIVQYNQFENQLRERHTTWSQFCEGVWRFAIGLGKKAFLAVNLSYIGNEIFAVEPASHLPVMLAWLGCFAYTLQIYFDFSGYSDMALGLGKMFGFELPENFLYPYTATSVTTYWQKWHITLGAWFRDYMFYPLTLGPIIRMKKRLTKKGVSKGLIKFLQNALVIFPIWLTTGIWHGAKWNYAVWGLLNGAIMLAEIYRKPWKRKRLQTALGWVYTIVFVVVTKAIVCTPDMAAAVQYLGSMLGLYGNALCSYRVLFLLQEYGFFLVLGTVLCFPWYKALKQRYLKPEHTKAAAVVHAVETVAVVAVLILALAYVQRNGAVSFIYQKF